MYNPSTIQRILAASLMFTLALFYSSGSFAEPTTYPLTIHNCNRDIVIPKKPDSVVTVGQNSTEILYSLGLADAVKATSLWFSAVLPAYAEVNKKIKILNVNQPSMESILGQRPDLIANDLEWSISPTGAIATYEQFQSFGIPVYTAPADCLYKDNLQGGDGLRTRPFSMDMIYLQIKQLAQIFDIEDRGDKLVATLKQREEKAKKEVSKLPRKNLTVLFWFSSADADIDPYVAGDYGAPAYMSKILGLKNIVDLKNEWPTVGWETIVKANPDVIVLADMDRRRFPMDDVKAKEKFLKSDPILKTMTAVKENHIVTMDAQAMNASIRTINGIETLANAISKMDFSK